MATWKKIVLAAVAVLAVLVVLSATLLPVLIRNKAVEALQETTGREVRIDKVSLNPLTLTATVKGFAIAEKGGGPFFSLGSLRVSVSPSSLFRLALVISEVSLDAPSLKVVRFDAERFNFSDILERLAKGEKKKEAPSGGIFPLVVQGFRLGNGSLLFDDQLVAGGRSHAVSKLEIAVPWLSTKPADAERDVTPSLSAVVNGSPLSVTGNVKPFGKERASQLRLTLEKLSLAELIAYAPQPLPVDLASAKLTLDLEAQYRQPAGARPEVGVKGLARLDEVDVKLAKGAPLLKFASLEVKASRLEPLAGLFEVESVTLVDPELFVSRNQRGQWMFASLTAPGPAGKAAAGKAPAPSQKAEAKTGEAVAETKEAAPLSWTVASFALKNGTVRFRDDLPKGGFAANIGEIGLGVRNITNRPGERGQYDLSLNVDRETRLASQGSFTLAEPSAQASLSLTGLPLQKGWPYLAATLTAPLKGIVDLAGEVTYGKEGVKAQKGSLALRDFAARYGQNEGASLKQLAVSGVSFDQKANRLVIERIGLAGGDVSLSREKDGKLSVQSLLVPQPEKPTAPEAAEAAKASAARPGKGAPAKPGAAKPLDYLVKNIEVDRFNVAFADKSRAKEARFSLRDTKVRLGGLSGPASRPAKFQFATTFGQEAKIEAAGDLTPAPFSYKGSVGIGRLPIRDFEAYFPDNLNVLILGGALDAALALDIALKESGMAGSFKGNAGLGGFHTVDAVEEEDLLKWQRLQIDGIDGGIGPFRLAINQVSLNELFARVIVRDDGSLNLQNLIKKEAKPEGEGKAAEVPEAAKAEAKVESKPAAQAATSAPAPPKGEPAPISIGTVTMLNGTISFTDKHLSNDFETTFYNLGGRISGLTSQASIMADVDLRGALENHSPLTITGKINPLREDLFVDLKLSFMDIDLSPMSPYSETYLGYILKQGKLFLDLKYHIENKELVSENKIKVDQFTFGDEVKSEQATSLPVKLGLALLKDRNGEINLDVPVLGRIDDPRFNIWGIVWQVIKNLLVKAVTSPFTLLSSLFGGGSDLSVVAFAPGSHLLTAEEEKKVESLAKGLSDRPALKMSLAAFVDKDKDPEAYRQELLDRKIKREKWLTLAKEKQVPEAEAGTLTLTPEEYTTYLKAVYAKEKFPKPRNALGKELVLPDPEMVKLILAHTKVEKDELEDLAKERAAAVMASLIGKGKIATERIFLKNEDVFKQPEKAETPKARVELNAITP